MSRKISDETKRLIKELYAENLSVAEITRRVSVSYTTVYGCTKVKKRGFVSYSEYAKHLAKERQQHPLNQKLSNLIGQKLSELGKTQQWLAKQLKITQGSVSRYVSGMTTPRRSIQERLFEALELPYQTLDDLQGDKYGQNNST